VPGGAGGLSGMTEQRAAPEVSVVVPIFNEEAVLPELQQRLGQVLDAACPDHEIIFVDDGSVDQSPALLLAASTRNPASACSASAATSAIKRR